MKKLLITGCNGLLGQNLVKVFNSQELYGIDVHPHFFGEPSLLHYIQLDITEKEKIIATIKNIKPDWVINTAAVTDVDGCEKNPEQAWQINHEAVLHIIDACKACGSGIVQLSTDYVFDGENSPYGEDDACNPLSVYGQTKFKAERELLKCQLRILIIRIMVLFGTGNNIRANFVSWLTENLSAGKSMKIVEDQYGNITLASNLAENIKLLLESNLSGIFHISSKDILSRYQLALRIADLFKLEKDLIVPCLTDDLGQVASRPLKSGFRLDKVLNIPGIKIYSAEKLLEKYMVESKETE